MIVLAPYDKGVHHSLIVSSPQRMHLTTAESSGAGVGAAAEVCIVEGE